MKAVWIAAVLATMIATAPAHAQTGLWTPLSKGGTGASLAAPGEDRFFFWDHSKSGGELLSLPAEGLGISGTALVLTNDLAGLEALAAAGFAVRTAADTWAARSFDDVANQTAWTNADGVAGNPSVSLDAEIACLGPLVSAADKLPYYTGAGTCALADMTSFGRGILDDVDAAAVRATLGVVIGTDVQAHAAGLDDIGSLVRADGNVIVGDGVNWVAESGNVARTSLGLGTGDSPAFAGLNLADGAAINWNAGDCTLAEGTNTLTIGGTCVLVTEDAGLQVGVSVPFVDAAGALTLQNVDALDATTEATIEAALDALPNLQSVQGFPVALADADVDAFFGWDDTAGEYGNLTSAEGLEIIKTVDGAGSGLDADTVDGAHVGTSGAAVPLLDGTNTWSAAQTHAALLDAAQAIRLSGDVTPPALAASVNNYDPAGNATASTLRLDGGAADRNITGLAGGADGVLKLVFNIGTTNTLILADEDVGSIAANRFALNDDIIIGPEQAALLRYDAVSLRWRAIGGTGGGGGGGSSFTAQSTPPGGATPGDVWLNTDSATLYWYYNDGSSSQWVEFAGGGVGATNREPGAIEIISTGDSCPGYTVKAGTQGLSKAAYARWWATIEAGSNLVTAPTVAGPGQYRDNGDGTFNAPGFDNNEFIRHADGTTRTAGSAQADGAPDIDGTFQVNQSIAAAGHSATTGALSWADNGGNFAATSAGNNSVTFTFAASADKPDTYNDANTEVVPHNVAYPVCFVY